MCEKAPTCGNICYSPARNSRITSPFSWSSLTNLAQLSPTKAGGAIPGNSVSADEVQCLITNSEKITLAWDDVWLLELDVTGA